MALNETTKPAKKVVTVAKAKSHLKVDFSDDDTLISNFIEAATDYVEERTRRQLITSTWELTFEDWPPQFIEIPRPPLQQINSIQYQDQDGNTQTWDSSNYEVDTKREPGRVRPVSGQSFPSLDDVYNAVTVNFDAGYGDSSSDVPDALVHAVKLLVAHFYENRELINKFASSQTNTEFPIPSGIELLINQHSMREFV